MFNITVFMIMRPIQLRALLRPWLACALTTVSRRANVLPAPKVVVRGIHKRTCGATASQIPGVLRAQPANIRTVQEMKTE
tara:strand:+ start:18642 stop:18881 length:240 start_codon:yes stop_codon:yes gene_type:complete